ncbi:MAG TPA: tetratricopeptide repeat protein [Terracidiphilus sp.]|nr:tetratricopeptide repeat protein [Terracidiphilus sp.]
MRSSLPSPQLVGPAAGLSRMAGVTLLALGLMLTAQGQSAMNQAAVQAMRQGGEAMAAGDFPSAAASYASVTREMPGFAEGYFNLGLALEQSGQLDQARAALEKSLRLKPSLRGANLFLGLVDYRQDRFKDAETYLARETAIDPRNAKAFMWLGVCRLAAGDPQGAIAPLDKAYALDPTDADILYHRGHAYLLVANASYDAMFKLDHDSMRVHQVLGEAYAQSYRNQEAVTEFELAVKMAPHQPGLHEELADQYWVLGNLDKAETAYRDELAIDPYATTAQYKLGSLLVLNGQAADGVALLRQALKADPTLSDAHYYLGTGLMATDQAPEAIHEFEMAIAADPGNDRAMLSYYKLSQIYRDRKDRADEESAMQNFLRMRSDEKARQASHAAQMVRRRSELPVEDPELASVPSG